MLVLSRRVDESIVIPGVGRITVLESRAGKVRLGFDVSREFNIIREEIMERDFNPELVSESVAVMAHR